MDVRVITAALRDILSIVMNVVIDECRKSGRDARDPGKAIVDKAGETPAVPDVLWSTK